MPCTKLLIICMPVFRITGSFSVSACTMEIINPPAFSNRVGSSSANPAARLTKIFAPPLIMEGASAVSVSRRFPTNAAPCEINSGIFSVIPVQKSVMICGAFSCTMVSISPILSPKFFWISPRPTRINPPIAPKPNVFIKMEVNCPPKLPATCKTLDNAPPILTAKSWNPLINGSSFSPTAPNTPPILLNAPLTFPNTAETFPPSRAATFLIGPVMPENFEARADSPVPIFPKMPPPISFIFPKSV